jgi:hypothetical protein
MTKRQEFLIYTASFHLVSEWQKGRELIAPQIDQDLIQEMVQRTRTCQTKRERMEEKWGCLYRGIRRSCRNESRNERLFAYGCHNKINSLVPTEWA